MQTSCQWCSLAMYADEGEVTVGIAFDDLMRYPNDASGHGRRIEDDA